MRSRRGFALMASLWFMVAIAALSLEVANGAQNRRVAAANGLEEQRARSAALSGIDHARARLSRIIVEGGDRSSWRDPRNLTDPWHRVRDSLGGAVGDARYSVRLHDLGARLNLHHATDAELRRYFGALRIDASRAEALIDALRDWTDADDHRRLNGAERGEYLRAGARDLPRNAPLGSVDDLASINGFSKELLARMRDDLTVLGSGQVNVNTARRTVLLALPGFTEASVEALVRLRESQRHIASWSELVSAVPRQSRAPLEAAASQLLPRLAYVAREIWVESRGVVDGSPVVVAMDAVLVRGGQAVFVTWSETR
jgi:type II secretory pathway component PulK